MIKIIVGGGELDHVESSPGEFSWLWFILESSQMLLFPHIDFNYEKMFGEMLFKYK